MKSTKRANRVAILGTLGMIVVMFLLLKLRNWMPLAVGGMTYLVLLSMLWPRRQRVMPMPDGVARADFDLAMERMTLGAHRLRREISRAPAADRALIARMADLIERIREHHLANPAHVVTTRRFIRHALSRMIEAVIDYVALTQRAGPTQDPRLSEIAAELRDFPAALERIDRACLDNDLDAFQVSVEVLNHQMDQRGR